MSDMADVLKAHGEWRYTSGAGSDIACRACGAPVENVTEHQAAALSAAGFGLVADAKAEALEEAAATFSASEPEGSYSSTPVQVIGWLREQATSIRSAS